MQRHTLCVLMVMLAALFLLAGGDAAWAQGIEYPPEYANSCTYNPQFNIPIPASGTGIISLLVQNIAVIVNGVARQLYETIWANYTFQQAVRTALTIFVVVYGVFFTFGLTQLTMMDFLIRIVKFGIVATLLAPGSWNFFYNFVGRFFHEGTDWLIAVMSNIALGTVAGMDPTKPFAVLDNAIASLTSSRMFVTLIATFFTGPYGVIIGLLIVMGIGQFASALFQAMWIYLMALVVRAFLFALAPIFFAFILFSRTRHLFDGWLTALLGSMLQPVFLFAFFAFFAKLIEAALYNLMRVPVCWTPPGVTWQGTPFDVWMWRFMVPECSSGQVLNGACAGGVWRWKMYSGGWSFTGADLPNAPIFPLGIMDVLIFVLLVQLASRFFGIALNIAREISGSSLYLNVSGAASQWMRQGGGGMKSLQSMGSDVVSKLRGSGLTDPAKAAKAAAAATGTRGGPGGASTGGNAAPGAKPNPNAPPGGRSTNVTPRPGGGGGTR